MSTPASRGREQLVAALESAGPEAPTLCAGWTARDLAAHLVVREHRPDAAVGIVLPLAAGYGERVRRAYRDGNSYEDLIAQFRAGPPMLSIFAIPPVESALNAVEFFVHTEDVRRGAGPAAAEPVDEDLERALWRRLTMAGPLLRRRTPAALAVRSDSGRRFDVPGPAPQVTVTGGVGELTLFFMGRGDAALVEFDGPPESVAALKAMRFGF